MFFYFREILSHERSSGGRTNLFDTTAISYHNRGEKETPGVIRGLLWEPRSSGQSVLISEVSLA